MAFEKTPRGWVRRGRTGPRGRQATREESRGPQIIVRESSGVFGSPQGSPRSPQESSGVPRDSAGSPTVPQES
eukprot:670174-Pyramimonas_sp.AAC.1